MVALTDIPFAGVIVMPSKKDPGTSKYFFESSAFYFTGGSQI
jgi:hypothetical protein